MSLLDIYSHKRSATFPTNLEVGGGALNWGGVVF